MRLFTTLDAPGDEKRLTIHASDLKSHGNVVKVDEDDLEHMRSKGDHRLRRESAYTNLLESLHNPSDQRGAKSLEDSWTVRRSNSAMHVEGASGGRRERFFRVVSTCSCATRRDMSMVLQIMMNAQKNMKVAAWRIAGTAGAGRWRFS